MPITTVIVLGVILMAFIAELAYWLSERAAGPTTYRPVTGKIYRHPPGWKGTPVDQKKRFVNYYQPFYQNYLYILRWLPSHAFNLIRNRGWKANVTYQAPAILETKNIIIWLGHASFFLNINGKKILVDPMFHHALVYRRHSDNPIAPVGFTNIDYLLITHDHPDHCDKKSIRQIVNQNPGITILAGSGMDALIGTLCKNPVASPNIITGEWYECIYDRYGLKIYFVPTQHYSKRLGRRFNSTLWGGFVICFDIEGQKKTILLGGDSGYPGHYTEIGNLFSIDIAILGIGAYKPRWFMRPNHMSPQEAVKAAVDCKAKWMIPMHFSTFNLSNEKMDDPDGELKKYRGTMKVKRAAIGNVIHIVQLTMPNP